MDFEELVNKINNTTTKEELIEIILWAYKEGLNEGIAYQKKQHEWGIIK